MKAMKLPKELQQFLKVAETVEEETLVFTKKKRPVAALVSLSKSGPRVVSVEYRPAVFENHRKIEEGSSGGKNDFTGSLREKICRRSPHEKDEANAKNPSLILVTCFEASRLP